MEYINSIVEQFRLDIEIMWSYKTNLISETIIIAILYISMIFLGTGQSIGIYYGQASNSKSLLLVGYVFWSFSIAVINIVASTISGEATQGTLEKRYMSVIPMHVLLIGDFLCTIFLEVIEVALIIIISIVIVHIGIQLNVYAILALIINLIGMYGIGLILGGIAVKEKKINNLVFIVQVLLLFITDTISKPKGFRINQIIPLTVGNDIARRSIMGIYVSGQEWIMFIAVSLLWLFIGVFVFNWFIKYSKNDGLLGTY